MGVVASVVASGAMAAHHKIHYGLLTKLVEVVVGRLVHHDDISKNARMRYDRREYVPIRVSRR